MYSCFNNVFDTFPILGQECDREETSCSTFPTLIGAAPVFGSLEIAEVLVLYSKFRPYLGATEDGMKLLDRKAHLKT